MKWIKITHQLPPFGERVLFRGCVNWRSKNKFEFFDDKLTTNEETFEYGHSAYLLENHDYAVSQNRHFDEVCDEFITHWCELPNFDEPEGQQCLYDESFKECMEEIDGFVCVLCNHYENKRK
jgi:hypothetical protein